mmetsp:Transcript_102841/g.286366  ORF Transcript_102841/g.286366 Transcript_102841/m.286366 type:complete len:523 (-) Transcript_102841:387-1955(-)
MVVCGVEACTDRQHLVHRGLDHEECLHLGKLLGHLLCQVTSLGEIRTQVIQLPDIRVGIPGLQPSGVGCPGDARAKRAGKPPVLVEPSAAHDLKVLRHLSLGGRGVVEGVRHGDPRERVLRHAVDHEGRLDPHGLVDRRDDVGHVVELRAWGPVGLNDPGPGDHQRRAGATKVGRHQLRALEGRVARPGPACVVHIVQVPRPQSAEPPILFLQQCELLVHGAGQHVLCDELRECALQPLCRGAVVRKDVDDQRVVGEALELQLIQELAVLCVRVLQEAGVHLHQAELEGALALRNVFPLVHGGIDLGELGGVRDPAHGLLLLERDLAKLLPAHVELALVLVRPIACDVVRPMCGPGCKVDEERAVWSEGPVVADELSRLGCHVLREVVPLLRRVRGFDRVRILIKAGLVLRRLARDETVEVSETQPCWVLVKGSCPEKVVDRCIVPLAKSSRVVAVVREHPGHSGSGLGNLSRVAREARRELRDLPGAHRVVVSSCQEGCSRGGAYCRVVEAVVRNPPRCNA